MDQILAVLVTGLPLLGVEVWSRIIDIHAELSRKLTHVLSSGSVILVAHIYGHKQLIFVSGVFLLVMLASRRIKLWKSLYRVKRKTYGEFAFVIGVGLASVITSSLESFVYCIALLGFADTAASMIGSRYGLIKIKGWDKSIEGSLAVFGSAVLIGLLLPGFEIGFMDLLTVAFSISVLEFIATKGLDNITVPVGAALYLELFL